MKSINNAPTDVSNDESLSYIIKMKYLDIWQMPLPASLCLFTTKASLQPLAYCTCKHTHTLIIHYCFVSCLVTMELVISIGMKEQCYSHDLIRVLCVRALIVPFKQ